MNEILDRFSFHPATAKTGPVHDSVRAKHAELAEWLINNIPPGRHQSLALTSLQESMMWSNAAVAVDTKE